MNSPYLNLPLRSEAEVRAAKINLPLVCPFCGADPPLALHRYGSPEFERYLVGCGNDDCNAQPSTSGRTIDEAWQRWNTRNGRTPKEQIYDAEGHVDGEAAIAEVNEMTSGELCKRLRDRAEGIFAHDGECVGADSAVLMRQAADRIEQLSMITGPMLERAAQAAYETAEPHFSQEHPWSSDNNPVYQMYRDYTLAALRAALKETP